MRIPQFKLSIAFQPLAPNGIAKQVLRWRLISDKGKRVYTNSVGKNGTNNLDITNVILTFGTLLKGSCGSGVHQSPITVTQRRLIRC